LDSRATARDTGQVDTDASLKAILDCVSLPVRVVDHDGLIVLANPAAVTTLGFDDVSALQGRHGHDTVHYKHPDGSPYPAEECPVLEPIRTGAPVHCDEDWFIRRDGTMFPVSVTAVPIELPTGRGVVMTFIDMTAQREAEQALRERDAILAQVAQPVWVVDHRTAPSCRSRTPRLRSSFPAVSAPSPPSPTSRRSSSPSGSHASATSPRRGPRSCAPRAGG
jgi:PAS domain S-box-containing protein